MDDRKRFIRRARWVGVLLSLMLVAVALRAGQLQIAKHEEMAKLAFNQYLNDVKIPARRGHIMDRHGKPLAISVEVPSVYANPMAVQDPRQAARQLAPLLEMPLDKVYRRLASERLFVWLRRQVAPEVAAKVRELNIPGISLTNESRRYYPNKETAAHLIGFTGVDVEGLEGTERALDRELAGEPQMIPTLRDGLQRKVLQGELDPSHRAKGADVFLTIDLTLQHEVESALHRAQQEYQAAAAMAVVLEVGSSEILAAGVAPTFNPNRAGDAPASSRRARVFTDMFEPGSTMKPLVVAAALDAGVIDLDTKVFCENGAYKVNNHTIRDGRPSGWLSLTDVIKLSSNIGAAKAGEALGKEALHDALLAMGLGKRTGVRFPGETGGMLRKPSTWSDLGLATISFGQGVAVTAVQLAAAYNVLASGGMYRAPTLVRQVQYPAGQKGNLRLPKARRLMRAEAAHAVTQMMEAAVTPEGTAWRGAVTGYRVAGKTGTAQKADPVAGGYSSDKFVALYGGFLPAEDPKVVIVVVVDEPKGAHGGGVVAAPVFAEIGAAAMRHLAVLPNATTVSSALQRARTLAAQREQAAMAAGEAPEPVPLAPRVPEAGTVPSFLGLTARQVVEQYTSLGLGLDVEVRGSGRVVRQSPPPGSKRTDEKLVLTLAAP